jgi:hypothetical protein
MNVKSQILIVLVLVSRPRFPPVSITRTRTTTRTGKSASRVARIFNLPYRRFSICGAGEFLKRFEMAEALPDAIRRYGRLEICVTL